MPLWWGSGEDPLLVHGRLPSHYVLTRQRKHLCHVFYKGPDPIGEGSTLMTDHLPQAPPPDTITLGSGGSTRTFVGGTSSSQQLPTGLRRTPRSLQPPRDTRAATGSHFVCALLLSAPRNHSPVCENTDRSDAQDMPLAPARVRLPRLVMGNQRQGAVIVTQAHPLEEGLRPPALGCLLLFHASELAELWVCIFPLQLTR